jgi:hypothetical protein
MLWRMNRQIPLLLLLGSFLIASAFAQGIYKWEDENGQTHYSDMPHKGADEVEIQPLQTFSLPEAAEASTTSAEESADADDAYQSIQITSPGWEETIWNTGGDVTVSLSLLPRLQTGHKVRLFMDGKLLADMPKGQDSVVLTSIERGEHSVTAEVQDQKGATLITSEAVKFFYQRTTVDSRTDSGLPGRPGPPKPPGGISTKAGR